MKTTVQKILAIIPATNVKRFYVLIPESDVMDIVPEVLTCKRSIASLGAQFVLEYSEKNSDIV